MKCSFISILPFHYFQVSLVLFWFDFWIIFKAQNFMVLYFVLTNFIIIISTILLLGSKPKTQYVLYLHAFIVLTFKTNIIFVLILWYIQAQMHCISSSYSLFTFPTISFWIYSSPLPYNFSNFMSSFFSLYVTHQVHFLLPIIFSEVWSHPP